MRLEIVAGIVARGECDGGPDPANLMVRREEGPDPVSTLPASRTMAACDRRNPYRVAVRPVT